MMSKYSKLDGESFNDYCHRIASYKSEDYLTWEHIANIINTEFDLSYSESFYRKREKNYVAYQENNDEILIEEQMLSLMKERVKISDERTQINALIRKSAREETLIEIANEAISKMSCKIALTPWEHKPYYEDKEALLLLSDWHYGAEVNNAFNVYNPDVAVKRIKKLQDEVIDKCKYYGISDISVANLGDMICGNIHLPLRINSRIDVITQVMQVSELLTEFLYNLSQHFNVHYYSTSDNHSRLEANKKDAIDLESLYRVTDWYLRGRLPGIDFNKNKFGDSLATFKILGHDIACVHGDKDKQSGITDKINNFTQQHFDLVCSAHLHHFSGNESQETLHIANGSLMGTDTYAYDLRVNSRASQNLIIVTNSNVADAICRIILD